MYGINRGSIPRQVEIDTQWNVNLINDNKFYIRMLVEIDTQWNVNK